LGSVPLEDLDASMVNELYASLLSDGLCPTTVRRVHATLHRALADAVKWGLRPDNPAGRSDPPRTRRHLELRTWSPAELRLFLARVRDDDFFALWFLLATTGMRRGEALGLQWADVDLERGSLAVRRTLISVSGRIEWSEPKSARGRRVVALDPATVAVLRSLGPGEGLVFCRSDGSPMEPTWVSKRFVRLVADSRLPRIRLHDLHHTHATLALEAGVNPKIVSERLGHATVAFTLDVYSHALQHLQREAADKVAALVLGA
jgi:integrase